MRKYAAGLVVVASLALYGAPGFAETTPSTNAIAATSASTVDITSTQRMVVFSRDRKWPRPGTHVVEIGLDTSAGANTTAVAVSRTTMTGHPSRHVWTYTSTSESYTAGVGVIRTLATGKMRIRGNRRIDTANGHVTEGLGAFSGVTGTSTITGNNHVKARIAKYVTRGTYTFP